MLAVILFTVQLVVPNPTNIEKAPKYVILNASVYSLTTPREPSVIDTPTMLTCVSLENRTVAKNVVPVYTRPEDAAAGIIRSWDVADKHLYLNITSRSSRELNEFPNLHNRRILKLPLEWLESLNSGVLPARMAALYDVRKFQTLPSGPSDKVLYSAKNGFSKSRNQPLGNSSFYISNASQCHWFVTSRFASGTDSYQVKLLAWQSGNVHDAKKLEYTETKSYGPFSAFGHPGAFHALNHVRTVLVSDNGHIFYETPEQPGELKHVSPKNLKFTISDKSDSKSYVFTDTHYFVTPDFDKPIPHNLQPFFGKVDDISLAAKAARLVRGLPEPK
jgi:hypothetical protein